MSKNIVLTNCQVANEGSLSPAVIIIEGNFIKDVILNPSSEYLNNLSGNNEIVDINGQLVIPGVIDDQVHFREPGLTSKADIDYESKAAVAGGITSFMDMPNTVPNAITSEILEQKYEIAKHTSYANYSFYIGASNDNIKDLSSIDYKDVCGIKVFMGASTGNMLVDNIDTLSAIFQIPNTLVTTHCEDEQTIVKNTQHYKSIYNNDIPMDCHPKIRDTEACYKSSSLAVSLAKKYNTKLHILHLSTSKELALFDNKSPLKDKRITAEVCVHHLWFEDKDYERLSGLIKCNPSIKTKTDRDALLEALNKDYIDVVATDHAPHTFEEKQNPYLSCPSGLPSVQFSLLMMLDYFKKGKITLEKIVEKMCHNPAILFNIDRRGFIRKGYYADLTIVDLNKDFKVSDDIILSKCGWSPYKGHTFGATVTQTYINGQLVYDKGKFNKPNSMRLKFNR